MYWQTPVIYPYLGKISNLTNIFSDGLKPPTSKPLCSILFDFHRMCFFFKSNPLKLSGSNQITVYVHRDLFFLESQPPVEAIRMFVVFLGGRGSPKN